MATHQGTGGRERQRPIVHVPATATQSGCGGPRTYVPDAAGVDQQLQPQVPPPLRPCACVLVSGASAPSSKQPPGAAVARAPAPGPATATATAVPGATAAAAVMGAAAAVRRAAAVNGAVAAPSTAHMAAVLRERGVCGGSGHGAVHLQREHTATSE